MPHLTIEYSTNLESVVDIDAATDLLHAETLTLGLAPVPGHRTRAVPRSNYRIADGDPSRAMVAITARIGPGRTPETKKAFITHLLDTAEKAFASAEGTHTIAFSAEVQEIDAEFRENRNHITI